jgi:hypothetical protein
MVMEHGSMGADNPMNQGNPIDFINIALALTHNNTNQDTHSADISQ